MQFGISINPKKSIFVGNQGKVLGHIISREGLVINPNKYWDIISTF